MYKVLIVDDDRIIRRNLMTTIAWKEHGYFVVSDASNGEAGIEMVKKHKPHIVISDIKMPFMDGLEMSKEIREIFPKTKIILLTGYEDFQYAKEAIKLKAFDYLLKPVDGKILLEQVKQATKEIELEKEAEIKLSEVMTLLREDFMKKLLDNNHSWNCLKLNEEMEFMNLHLNGPSYVVFIVKLEIDMSKQQPIINNLKREIISFLHEEILSNGLGYAIDYKEDEIVIVYSCHNKLVHDDFVKIANHMQDMMQRKFQQTISISIGEKSNKLMDVASSYEDAKNLMELRYFKGKGKVLSRLNASDLNWLKEIDLDHLAEELAQTFKLGISSELDLFFEKLNKMFAENYAHFSDVHQIVLKFILVFLQESEKLGKEWDRHQKHELIRLYQDIIKLQTVNEIIEKVRGIGIKLIEDIRMQNENQKGSIVQQAIRFIEKNYHQEKLTLEKIAKEVHVSPAYLCNLFKVETGINFGEFLLEIRMEKAMELLRVKRLKTYEVAEKVGYSNPQYFSICFKRYTNYSPAEYKKLC